MVFAVSESLLFIVVVPDAIVVVGLVMLVLVVSTLKLEPLTVVVLLLSLSPNPIVLELISVSVSKGILILGVVVFKVKTSLVPALFLILMALEVISVIALFIFNLLPLKVIVSPLLEPSSFEEISIVLPSSKMEFTGFVSLVDFSSI